MTTIAIIGAGKGLGAAVARRFGAEGFAVGLISRHQGRLDALAAELAADGIQAQGFTADVRDPASIAARCTGRSPFNARAVRVPSRGCIVPA